jgi:thiamine pyrophosphate-dependent acetolactate synthase large subunit-like protein
MGPVFVSLPVDDMPVELDDTQLSDINVVRARQVTHATAFPDHMAKEIARRLAAAKAPLFIRPAAVFIQADRTITSPALPCLVATAIVIPEHHEG